MKDENGEFGLSSGKLREPGLIGRYQKGGSTQSRMDI